MIGSAMLGLPQQFGDAGAIGKNGRKQACHQPQRHANEELEEKSLSRNDIPSTEIKQSNPDDVTMANLNPGDNPPVRGHPFLDIQNISN